MKRVAGLVVLLVVVGSALPMVSARQANASPAGEWVGGYETSGNYVVMKGRFKAEGDGLSGTLDLPQIRLTNVAAKQVRYESPRFHFEVPMGNGPLVFQGKMDGEAIVGEITYGNQRGTFHLVRTVTVDPKALEQYVGEYQIGKNHFISVGKT